MNILYLDCFSGISGDMLIGALLDAGLSFTSFKKECSRLQCPEDRRSEGNLEHYEVRRERVKRSSLSGTRFSVIVKNDLGSRKLADIEKIIQKSRLSKDIKGKAIRIFRNMAESEAKAHGTSAKRTHLHEVASIDSIIDVVGAVVALKMLKIDRIYSSVIRLGKGKTRIAHGTLPIPAPATLNLLENTPVIFTNIRKELVTPTGAAILRTLAFGFGDMPRMKIVKTGYGAGQRELKEQPNMLRAVIGTANPYIEDTISILETNIDDMNPQFFEPASRKLFKAGALDVFLTPVFMKKFRPGILLTVLCENDLVDKMSAILFKETTTIGVRFYNVKRNKLNRFIKSVKTKYGPMRCKVSYADELLKIRPEYEDIKKII